VLVFVSVTGYWTKEWKRKIIKTYFRNRLKS
jgi:hypothetical protein